MPRTAKIFVGVYAALALALFAAAAYRLHSQNSRQAALFAAGGLYSLVRLFMVLRRARRP